MRRLSIVALLGCGGTTPPPPRDLDVWSFMRPADVAEGLPRLQRRIGRRYGFWSFLIQGWRSDGLLAV